MIKKYMGSHIRMSGIQILVQKLYEISETTKFFYAQSPYLQNGPLLST